MWPPEETHLGMIWDSSCEQRGNQQNPVMFRMQLSLGIFRGGENHFMCSRCDFFDFSSSNLSVALHRLLSVSIRLQMFTVLGSCTHFYEAHKPYDAIQTVFTSLFVNPTR